MLAKIAGTIHQLGNIATILVLAGFFSLAVRAAFLLLFDRGHGALIGLWRAVAAVVFAGLGSTYWLFTSNRLFWDWKAVVAALCVGAAMLVTLRRHWSSGRSASTKPVPRVRPAVIHLGFFVILVIAAMATLMWSGFLALTTDRPVLLVDVTGATRPQTVTWAPPDGALRKQILQTHQVVFRNPKGRKVAEAWIYGDQVAVKGKVLRLSPVLNAAGIPNLFELQFAHNGFASLERHNAFPHRAIRLPQLGPLQTHRWWRSLQRRLLQRWEQSDAESDWAIRAATVESTYFPLADAAGHPARRVYRLVLTPGGLTSS